MIDHPIRTIRSAGIENIMIVTGHEHSGAVFNYCGDGSRFDCNFNFAIQTKPDGIAGALGLCRSWAGEEPVMVVLGDNIFGDLQLVTEVSKMGYCLFKCAIFVKKVKHPERFGVVTLGHGNSVISIAEKPKKPASNLIVTGCYIFPPSVWDVILNLKPSDRGELEVTDIIRAYMPDRVHVRMLDDLYWSDAGTMESYQSANQWAWEHIK
jgi:glucose-1-phosphate thymidylyltransferase